MEDINNGGQWAILPAMVRYDRKLPANAKLIYAEIAAKINEDGFCFASNRYFAERLGLKEDTVSGLVSRLADAEYITVDLDAERQNKDKRRIYLTGKPYDFTGGIGFISGTGKKSGTVSEKNPIPLENNNIIKNNPPKPPKGERRERRKPSGSRSGSRSSGSSIRLSTGNDLQRAEPSEPGTSSGRMMRP